MRISLVSGGLPSGYSFLRPTAVPDGGTSFVRFALPFAFRFVRSVSGGQLSSFFLMTAVSGGMTSFVRFACPFAFRFVRRVLGGLLSSCSFLSSSCPILGPKISGGTCLFSISGGVFFLASVNNVKIVPYATPIRNVLRFFSLVMFNQDLESVSSYTIQTYTIRF